MDHAEKDMKTKLTRSETETVSSGLEIDEITLLLGPAGKNRIKNDLKWYKYDQHRSREDAIAMAAGKFAYNDEIYQAALSYASSIYEFI